MSTVASTSSVVSTERYTKNNISAITPTVIAVTFAVPLLPTSN